MLARMSEVSKPSQVKPEILPLSPDPNKPGSVCYVVKKDTSGQDLLATVYYLEEPGELRRTHVSALCGMAIEKGALKNRTVSIGDLVSKVSEQAYITHSISFGDEPSLQELEEGLAFFLKEEAYDHKMEDLLTRFTDAGFLTGCSVSTQIRNEFVRATPDSIEFAMEALVSEFRKQQ